MQEKDLIGCLKTGEMRKNLCEEDAETIERSELSGVQCQEGPNWAPCWAWLLLKKKEGAHLAFDSLA